MTRLSPPSTQHTDVKFFEYENAPKNQKTHCVPVPHAICVSKISPTNDKMISFKRSSCFV